MASADPEAIARKLGYATPAELILHLPLRYEDETRLTPLAQARVGQTVQVEGIVVHAEVQNRPRRQLVVEVRAIPLSPWERGGGEGGVPQGRNADAPAFQDLLNYARQLRREQTDAENLVWTLLRAHRLKDAKFRRQHPVGPYILDFYCPEIRIAIELDGGQHMAQAERDKERTTWLEHQGIRVLRFWNNDVLTQTEAVLTAIWQAIPEPELRLQETAGLARPLSPTPLPIGEGTQHPHLYFRLLHFYPNQLTQLKPGVRVRLLGEVRPGFFGAEMVHPRMRIVRAGTPLPDRLTPVYPTVAGLSQNAIRKAVEASLAEAELGETLPEALLRHLGLPGFAAALAQLHHPAPGAELALLDQRDAPAWQRLKFDELLAQQLSLRLAARQRQALSAPSLDTDGGLSEQLMAALPFALTEAQGRALAEIRADLARPHPMNRLLQGDVGSGKTLVAALAVLPALAEGGQAAVMAPTEILAEQLYLKFHEWLEPLGLRVAWVAAGLKGKAKKETLAAIAAGQVRVAVGTHALFQAGVAFANLTLAVVDEQHRFGVGQRLALREKGQLPSPPGASSSQVRGAGGEGAIPPKHYIPLREEALEFARQLRKTQTDAEQLMWQLLRDRRLAEAKFQRQKPVGPYYLDFYCHEHRLAIELDGGQHAENRAHDEERDRYLKAQGIEVLRFWNNQVLAETDAVLETIWGKLQGIAPSPPGTSSPQVGGQGEGAAVDITTTVPSPPAPLPEGEGSHTITPHLLMMSATPIPRSLAMSYYADLDVSVIDQLPPGRTPIATKLVSDARRDEVIGRLKDYCLSGAQAYWVCPLVEESEKLQLRAAEASHAELVELLPELNIGLVHGRMKGEEKAAVMAAFKAGELHLLVATTVIEVGVDVPNAALMVIEHAERYGLAQLHQLRGRVGRGTRESTCLLMYGNPLSDTAKQRLRVIKENADGFAIAREDLHLRGPGEFLGARQSGLPMLRFADLERDLELLEAARQAAQTLLEQEQEAVRRHLARWLPRGLDYLRA